MKSRPAFARLTCIKILAAFVALGACALAPAAAPATEADLPAAREAAQKGNLKALEQWRDRFAGHPLEAYPAYWLLAARIEQADPAELRAFLEVAGLLGRAALAVHGGGRRLVGEARTQLRLCG